MSSAIPCTCILHRWPVFGRVSRSIISFWVIAKYFPNNHRYLIVLNIQVSQKFRIRTQVLLCYPLIRGLTFINGFFSNCIENPVFTGFARLEFISGIFYNMDLYDSY